MHICDTARRNFLSVILCNTVDILSKGMRKLDNKKQNFLCLELILVVLIVYH